MNRSMARLRWAVWNEVPELGSAKRLPLARATPQRAFARRSRATHDSSITADLRLFEAKGLQTVSYGGMAHTQHTRSWPLFLLWFLVVSGSHGPAEAQAPASAQAGDGSPVLQEQQPAQLPCVESPSEVQSSLQGVFERLRSSQVTSLPGPAGEAIRAKNAAEVARSHLDVEYFAKEVFRALWSELDADRRGAWQSTLQSLLQHRYVERIRDPRRHRLKILSAEVDCHMAKVRVALQETGKKNKHTLEFHMRLSSHGWRVYDVVLEGASLVNSWRSRLSRVYREEGHDGLDKQLHRLMRRYGVSP